MIKDYLQASRCSLVAISCSCDAYVEHDGLLKHRTSPRSPSRLSTSTTPSYFNRFQGNAAGGAWVNTLYSGLELGFYFLPQLIIGCEELLYQGVSSQCGDLNNTVHEVLKGYCGIFDSRPIGGAQAVLIVDRRDLVKLVYKMCRIGLSECSSQ